MTRPSLLESFIVTAGLLAAAAAGVVAYGTVGLYGDGPFAGGLYREHNPATGKWMLVHESRTSQGRVRRIFNADKELQMVVVDSNNDGQLDATVAVTDGKVAGVGFSLSNDGVIDAWAYRDAAGALLKIEVSTRQDGKIDRWEHYANNFLTRVDLDTNRNGKVDRWQTYEEGILLETFVDANEDGKPDGPPSN